MILMIAAVAIIAVLIVTLIFVAACDIKYGYNDDLIKSGAYEDKDFMEGYLTEYPEGFDFDDIDKIQLVENEPLQSIDEWYGTDKPINKDKITNFNIGDDR